MFQESSGIQERYVAIRWLLAHGNRVEPTLRSGNDCFFIKEEVVEPGSSYADLNDQYDYCYRVSTVDVRDFGSQDMQHWQVGGN